MRQGGDFIGFVWHGGLRQGGAGLVGECGQQVQGLFVGPGSAPQGFAIDGQGLDLRIELAEPLLQALVQMFGVQVRTSAWRSSSIGRFVRIWNVCQDAAFIVAKIRRL